MSTDKNGNIIWHRTIQENVPAMYWDRRFFYPINGLHKQVTCMLFGTAHKPANEDSYI